MILIVLLLDEREKSHNVSVTPRFSLKVADLVSPPPVPVTRITYVPGRAEVLVEIVRVEVNVGFGVPIIVLSLDGSPSGAPLTLNCTGSGSPPVRVTVILLVMVSPGSASIDICSIETRKLNSSVTVNRNVSDLVRPSPVPVTVTV